MLDYFALLILFFTVIVLFYGIIVIHDIPYEIAKHRKHPHQDAIHATGWISLFTLHVLWPFLWIWATLYREDRGWGFGDGKSATDHVAVLEQKVADLGSRILVLEGGETGGKSSITETEADSQLKDTEKGGEG